MRRKDAYWQFFALTGSVEAYLYYRELRDNKESMGEDTSTAGEAP